VLLRFRRIQPVPVAGAGVVSALGGVIGSGAVVAGMALVLGMLPVLGAVAGMAECIGAPFVAMLPDEGVDCWL